MDLQVDFTYHKNASFHIHQERHGSLTLFHFHCELQPCLLPDVQKGLPIKIPKHQAVPESGFVSI